MNEPIDPVRRPATCQDVLDAPGNMVAGIVPWGLLAALKDDAEVRLPRFERVGLAHGALSPD